MGSALFYHLTRSAAEQLLPVLIGKSRAAGWRVELRGTDAGRMARLDEALWQGEGFLPHGLAGGPHDALQPVLLTTAPQPEARDCLMLVDGAGLTLDEAGAVARTCVVFDGGDGDQLSRARALWVQVTGAGIAAQYWAQEDGRWVKKQERAARGT